jgi:hypothetical protein
VTAVSEPGVTAEDGPSYGVGSGLRRALAEQGPLLALVGTYTLGVYLAEWAAGMDRPLRNVGFANFYFLFVVAAGCYAVGALALSRWKVRGPNGEWVSSWGAWKVAWTECRRWYFTGYRLGSVAVISAAMLLLLRTYSSWKPLISVVVPFGAMDERFMRLDAAVHFGHHPWAVLHPLLGHPIATLTIDLLYALWLPVNFVVLLWQAGIGPSRDRTRFLLAYALIWIVVGTLMATPLSSAGPCYYSRVAGAPDPYAALMAYLGSLHAGPGLIALQIQENLWTFYTGRAVLPLNGISAMPSMHVAGAVLFALAGWRASRAVGLLLTGYALVILVGSVHLAWHYAVDGYVAAAVTLVLWWVMGWYLRWRSVPETRAMPSRPA